MNIYFLFTVNLQEFPQNPYPALNVPPQIEIVGHREESK